VALFVYGCPGEVRPCTTCPPIEGGWTLVFEAPREGGCAEEGPEPSSRLDLERTGAALRGTLGEAQLRGTLYDTYDLTLSGASTGADGGVVSTVLRARYVPAIGGGADGGLDRLVGSLSVAPSGSCEVIWDLQGLRAP
jgi:hypothetical protein